MTGQTDGEILLDASELEPPEPLQRAIEILKQLAPGQYLRMLHRRLPNPLFDACDQLGIEYRHFPGEQVSWIVLFWRKDDPITAKLCRKIAS